MYVGRPMTVPASSTFQQGTLLTASTVRQGTPLAAGSGTSSRLHRSRGASRQSHRSSRGSVASPRVSSAGLRGPVVSAASHCRGGRQLSRREAEEELQIEVNQLFERERSR
jgi:hypothetical protein